MRLATASGSQIRYGVAATLIAGCETASSSPLRSVIAPRRAGTVSVAFCCVAAAPRSASALTTPSHSALPAGEAEADEEEREDEPDASLDQAHQRMADRLAARSRSAGAVVGALVTRRGRGGRGTGAAVATGAGVAVATGAGVAAGVGAVAVRRVVTGATGVGPAAGGQQLAAPASVGERHVARRAAARRRRAGRSR